MPSSDTEDRAALEAVARAEAAHDVISVMRKAPELVAYALDAMVVRGRRQASVSSELGISPRTLMRMVDAFLQRTREAAA
jgi:hypothetical protein